MTAQLEALAPQVAEVPTATIATRVGLKETVRSEWIKLWSVRSTAWTLASLVVLGVGLTALVCATSADWLASPEADESPTSFVTWGMMIAQLTAVVLGVLVVSSEYATGMIRTTVAATPRRSRVLVAKSLVVTGVLFVAGVVTAVGGYFAGNAFLDAAGVGVPLDQEGVLRALVGNGLYLALLGLMAAALALLVRHTAAAISVLLGLVFVVGNLVGLIPGAVGDWLEKLMPGNAGSSIASVEPFNPNLLGAWTGFGVFALETAVLLVIAGVAFARRDV
jgi:ABC-2 type transport system permease protein